MNCPYCKMKLKNSEQYCNNCGQKMDIQSLASSECEKFWESVKSLEEQRQVLEKQLIKREKDKQFDRKKEIIVVLVIFGVLVTMPMILCILL